MSKIGELIKEKREAARLSQCKLGKACRLSDSEICKIENGQRKKPNWENLCKIAKVLGVHPFEFMLVAGYISEEDVHQNVYIRDLDKLNKAEIETVQTFIDFIISRNELNKNVKGGL